MNLFRRLNTIYINTGLTLAFGLISFTLLSILLVFYFVLSPMADRGADDMGGLIHIISKSWLALPENKKAEFQVHLREQHHLLITDNTIPVTELKSTYPFIPKLEKALKHHFKQEIYVKQSAEEGSLCFWIAIPNTEQVVNIGFLHDRFGPHPPKAMFGILAAGLFLILITTLFLARRITRPIKTLSTAVNLIGSGQLSTRIPEKGPQELAILARNFNSMVQEITQLMSNRSILFGGISHDLRTPITRMQIALELLESFDNAELIADMRNDLNEMELLIQNALEFVKGMDKHRAFKVKINKILNELASDYARQKHTIDWQSNCNPCKVEINALRRVLCNLLDNAFRYSNNKPVNLNCTQEKNTLLIHIIDQGPGIPEDKLNAVFQPFYRLDNSRNKDTGGSGLGLAIVQQLCDIHDWKIELLPGKNKGLEVKLKIPIR